MADVTTYFYNGGLNCAETTLRCLIENGIINAPLDTVRMMTGFGGGRCFDILSTPYFIILSHTALAIAPAPSALG